MIFTGQKSEDVVTNNIHNPPYTHMVGVDTYNHSVGVLVRMGCLANLHIDVCILSIIEWNPKNSLYMIFPGQKSEVCSHQQHTQSILDTHVNTYNHLSGVLVRIGCLANLHIDVFILSTIENTTQNSLYMNFPGHKSEYVVSNSIHNPSYIHM